ncbi:LamG-like jellyroll fold domain-containing protein [Streptomyces sp. SID5910]|uniref:LamG-like jellyroll fold domain-containing protein n=1 Tax=Streptomyces sp. SID5910 TaxID=2690312 RepID=UPI00136BBCB9|nr:hypothetical protein [Streptomyces sp. SID5910]
MDGAAVCTWGTGRVGQVVGRRAADGSTWGLWYEAARFGRLNADGTYAAVTSAEAARPDEPVRLTGVYDAQDGEVKLYIGTTQNGEAHSVPTPSGSGVLTVGGTTDGESWTRHLPGRIRDVRVWAGAADSAQQLMEMTGG